MLRVNRVTSNIASTRNKRYTKDSLFWLAQMRLHVMMFHKYLHFVRNNVISDSWTHGLLICQCWGKSNMRFFAVYTFRVNWLSLFRIRAVLSSRIWYFLILLKLFLVFLHTFSRWCWFCAFPLRENGENVRLAKMYFFSQDMLHSSRNVSVITFLT